MDSLTSIQLNYKWRKLLAILISEYFQSDDTEISLDNQDYLTVLIEDLYTLEETAASGVIIENQTIDLVTDKSTTSTSYIDLPSGGVSFVAQGTNAQITFRNVEAKHSGVSEILLRARSASGGLVDYSVAAMSGSTPKELSFSCQLDGLTVGASVTVNIEYRVSTGGTVTVLANTWIAVEIIQWSE